MKIEKHSEKSNFLNKKESDLLQYDCKNLLMSLKLQQNILLESINKLNDFDDINKSNKSSSHRKSVSFEDYLISSNNFEICEYNRKARSASPVSNKNISFNSILKNSTQVNNNEIEAFNSHDSNKFSDVYADMHLDDDFDENIRSIIKYTDLKLEKRFLNVKSLIDYISKKRDKYLNHDYISGSCSSLNDQSLVTDTFIKFNKQHDKNKKMNFKIIRSKSADCSSSKNLFETKRQNSKKKSNISHDLILNKVNDKSNFVKIDNKKEKKKKHTKSIKISKKNKTLLGFDWALDNLDSKGDLFSKNQKSDEYWEELNKFRSENKEECISSKKANFNLTFSSFLDYENSFFNQSKSNENDEKNHKCIHSFTLNERLFPIPIYKDKNGQSLCPVCKSARKEASSFSPQLCKISIPKSKLGESISIEPIIRSAIDSEDTLSLAENCFAGYQRKKTNNISSKNKLIGLKSCSNLNDKVTKLSLADIKHIETNRDPAICGIYNKANAMRYDLEDQHQKRLRELMPKINKV